MSAIERHLTTGYLPLLDLTPVRTATAGASPSSTASWASPGCRSRRWTANGSTPPVYPGSCTINVDVRL